jgi:hypothetical protein
MASERCEPPEKHRHLRWHWIDIEGDEPVIWQWLSAIGLPLDADDPRRWRDEHGMYWAARQKGIRYLAPAIPPEKGETDGR